MPAILTHKSIMLLARERLARIRDDLQLKVDNGATVSDLEHRVLYLAKKAHEMMSVSPPPPLSPTAQVPFGHGVSRFAVMGSLGPGITGYSGLLSNGSEWLYNLQRKGTPDEHLEHVVARTTDFALDLWTRVSTLLGQEVSDTAQRERYLSGMRAYMLGYVSHIAGQVLSSPYFDGLEWQLGAGSVGQRYSLTGQADARVAVQVLMQEQPREGADTVSWWPTLDDIPPQLFTAYARALENVHYVDGQRPHGLAEFEETFSSLDPAPPALTPESIRDGYNFYLHEVLNMEYGFGRWNWWAFLLPMYLPLLAMAPVAGCMKHSRKVFEKHPWDVDDADRPMYELLTVPLAVASPVVLFYAIYGMALTRRSMGGLTGWGLGTSIAAFIAGVVALATTDVDDLPGWLRWGVLFGAPFGISATFFVLAMTDLDGGRFKPGRAASGVLRLIYSLPLILLVTFLVAYFLFYVAIYQAAAGVDNPEPWKEPGFWVIAVLIAIILGISWFFLARALMDAIMPEMPDDMVEQKRRVIRRSTLPVDRPRFVRLFDEATLFHAPDVADPTLAHRRYPSGPRKLIKLWWTGTGDLYIRPGREQLEFSYTGVDADPIQVVPAPLFPITASEYAQLLVSTVKESGTDATGKLGAAMVYSADLDYELPAGAVFSDHGDNRQTTAQHDAEARRWVKLTTADGEDVYILRHAPKAAQAVFMGRAGTVASEGPLDESVPGPGTISSAGTTVTGEQTLFTVFFSPGDVIAAAGQQQVVVRIDADDRLTLGSAFSPALPAGTSYVRLGMDRERIEGYSYVANPTGTLGTGESVMDLAADFASLLCMGIAPHLMTGTELEVSTLDGRTAVGGDPVSKTLGRVYQVFRNWNLDRRRVNEWRMLVSGGAYNEKRGASDTYDAPMSQPRDSDYHPAANDTGERISRQVGWVGVLRRWTEVARDLDVDALATTSIHPGDPTNQELSRALAYLLDLPEPVTLA